LIEISVHACTGCILYSRSLHASRAGGS
jgi:hypothetical protein